MSEDQNIERLRELAQSVSTAYEARRAAISARNAAIRAASAAGVRNRDLIQQTGLKEQQVIRIRREAPTGEDTAGDVEALARQVEQATTAYEAVKAERNEAIWAAEAAGVKPGPIIEATGLSRDRVRVIRRAQ